MSVSNDLLRQKAAIYIRVSTHWQVDKDSLQVQRRELAAYCTMVLNVQEYEVFEDPGYSAKNTDRPAYQTMMSRLRTGEFSHLLVWKIDRISRNLLDFTNMYEELKSLGVTFVSKNENFDTSSAIGEAMLKIILVFAELERQMTAERVTSVMLSRANNGQWNGGHIPYGYDYDKETGVFSINASEAAVIEKIYDMYEKSRSLVYISRTLNDSGYVTRNGLQWTPTTVHLKLTNIFYTGGFRYNVHKYQGKGKYSVRDSSEWITVEDHHPAIISKDRFDTVQKILSHNQRGAYKPGDTYTSRNVHVFAGLLRCGKCGANMSATVDRPRANGRRPSLYGCSTRRKSHTACLNKYVSDVTIGPFIFSFVSNILKCQNSLPLSASIKTLQKKLLSGDVFNDVESINRDDLKTLLAALRSEDDVMAYRPDSAIDNDSDDRFNERKLLTEKRIKDCTALERLKTLYLYGSEAMPEKDYIIERQRLVGDIESIDARLSELSGNSESGFIDSREFIDKASYFIVADQLMNSTNLNYEKYIASVDPSVPKSFMNAIIDNIIIDDGRVSRITFKNGLTVRFVYGY